MRKKFTWLLSLMVTIGFLGIFSRGYTQEVQKTVELYAESVSACYNESNVYEVKVSVRDFINITQFALVLDYPEGTFDYVSFTPLAAWTGGPVSITDNPTTGKVTFGWTSTTPVTIGDNVKTDVGILKFKLDNFPNLTATSFGTAGNLKWETWNFYKSTLFPPATQDFVPVNTAAKTDGGLVVTVAHTSVATSIAAESCFGGQATVTVTAPAGVSYMFNEGATPATWVFVSGENANKIQASAGETVTVRVKDANGCISHKHSVTIPQTVDPVAFTVNKQDPVCYGANGTIIIQATGGTGPYTYYVNTSASLTGATTKDNFQFTMPAGVAPAGTTYYVAVQDANGCVDLSDEDNWENVTLIDANQQISITKGTVTNVLCYNGTTGSVPVTVDPAGVYSVSINGGNSWEETESDGTFLFENLAAGTYTVKAKNANGCTAADLTGVVVTQPTAPITFGITIKDTSCGGNNDGEITVTNVAGGTSPYTYSINNVDWQAGTTFSNLSPTYYSLWVKDANGCTVAYNNPNGTGNVIAVQSPTGITFTVAKTNALCNGGTGSITVTAQGGSGSYIYALNTGAFQTSNSFTNLAPGNYIVHVKNATAPECMVSTPSESPVVITQPAILAVTATATFPPTCEAGTDGYVVLNISGGTAGYRYALNGGPLSTATNNPIVNVAATVGTHSIKVVDANGCEATTSATVTQSASTITASSAGVITCYGTKTGIINASTTAWPTNNLTPRTLVYKYSTTQGAVFTSGTQFTPGTTTFNAGDYWVGAVDEYGCQSNVEKVTITQNPMLEIVGVTANGASCFNTFDGVITIIAKGGTGTLQYAVLNTNIDISQISADRWVDFPAIIDGVRTASVQATKGTYYVFVKDNTCSANKIAYGQPVVVTGYDAITVNATAIAKVNVACNGGSTGSITIPMSAVSGGAGAYKFTLLDASSQPITGKTQLSVAEFTGLAAGTYYVKVEDAQGCPSHTTAAITITQPAAALAFTLVKKNISCFGANDGLITVNVAGGTAPYSYMINNTNSWFAFGTDVTSKTYVATAPGTYSVTVRDANGCVAVAQSVTILEPSAVTGTVVVNNNVTCNGLTNGQVTVTGAGGWNITGTMVSTFEYKLNNGTYTASNVFSSLPAGNHTIYVKAVNTPAGDFQAHGECVTAVPFTITQPSPIVYTVSIDPVKCKGGSNGALTVNVISGGTPNVTNGYNVRLIGNAYDQNSWTGTDHSVTFSGLAHSHYTVHITDANGCTLKATAGDNVSPYETIESFEVNEPATALSVLAQHVKNVSCFGGSDGSFTITAAGGNAPYKFYTALSAYPPHIIQPDPVTTAWIAAEGNTYTKTNATAGTWIVWVMDANGCIVGGEVPAVNDYRVQITQPLQIVYNDAITFVAPLCNGASNGSLAVSGVAGGTAPYRLVVSGTSAAGQAVSYTSTAANSSSLTVSGIAASNSAGYSVKVIDANNCESVTKTIVVTQPSVLNASVAKAQGAFSCPDAIEGFIEATATGGTTPYQYRLWKNGAVFTGWVAPSSFLVQIGNSYTVEIKDANGCTATASIDIDPVLPAVITGIKDLTCFGATVPTVRLTATGDPGRTFEVSYQKRVGGVLVGSPSAWIPFSEADSHVISTGLTYGDVNDADGHYRFWIRDNAGCVSEYYDATFVPVQHALAMTHTVVEGECTSEVTFSVNGGIAPYELWIDGEMVEEGLEPNSPVTLTLDASEEAYSIVVRDAHECVTTAAELLIEANPVTDEVTVETYFGEETHYVNEAYEVDAMLNAAGSPYTFEFTTEEGCVRVLTVTVVEVYKEVAISEIQGTGAASPAVGMKRAIRGTVTGVVAGVGYFVQDKNEAWSGIWVADPATTVAIGNGVYVEGTVSEVDGVTTLTGTGTLLSAAPLAVTAIALTSPELAKDEKYESVLVQVKGVRAAAADANGRWEVFTTNDKRATVNKWLYTYAPVAGNFYDVTGIIDGRAANYYLNPRMASDIRDITATTDITVIDAVDFKVYPNPFNNELYIDNHNKLTRVSITNIAGQRVMDVQYPERVIRTANLVSGVYVISLFTEEGIVKSERIVKR